MILAVNCGVPQTPANGNAVFTDTTLGATVMHMCRDTFELCGPETRTCLASGSWSETVPRCISE